MEMNCGRMTEQELELHKIHGFRMINDKKHFSSRYFDRLTIVDLTFNEFEQNIPMSEITWILAALYLETSTSAISCGKVRPCSKHYQN